MTASNYLDGQENLYGLPSQLPDGLAEQASSIVDSVLKRPEGLIYAADKNGNPSYMKGLSPSFSYKIQGAVAPGSKVQVTVTPNIRVDFVGEVLVLDRANPDALETVVVDSVVLPNQVVFRTVQFAHADQTAADVGMVITEERNLPAKRSLARYSRSPMASLLSLMGRYAYGRRSDQVGGMYQEMNLLASVQTFGGPPQWLPIDINQASWSDSTATIWVPAGMLLAYYSDVKLKYVAGFPQVPDPVVRATCNIARSLTAGGIFGNVGNIKTISAGDTRIERFGATNVDEDTKKLLSPFNAQLFW